MSVSLKKLVRPRMWIVVADLLWIAVALAFARILHIHSLAHSQLLAFLPAYLISVVFWTGIAYAMRLNQIAGGDDIPAVLSGTVVGVMIFMLSSLAVSFVARELYSRLEFFYFGCFLLLGFTGIRLLSRVLVRKFCSVAAVRTVILGSGRLALEVARKISAHPEYLRKFVGFLYPANHDLPGVSSQSLRDSTTFPAANIQELLKSNGVQEIILAGGEATAPHAFKLVQACRAAGIRVSVIPSFYDLYSSRARVMDLDGLPVLMVEGREPGRFMFLGKAIIDLSLVVPLSLLVLPVIVVSAAILVLRGRPPFCSEVRCGLNGSKFRMWRLNVERSTDDASSRFEEVARRLSITEMPQLLNVWRREMSLVGPRPESAERVKHYSDWQRRRMLVMPGLTGAAQVKGLRDEHSSDDKARHDLQYIYSWSPFLDLSLLLQTVWTLIRRMNAPIRRRNENRPTETRSEVTLGVADVNSAQPSAD